MRGNWHGALFFFCHADGEFSQQQQLCFLYSFTSDFCMKKILNNFLKEEEVNQKGFM
jgi:hypothetical protein